MLKELRIISEGMIVENKRIIPCVKEDIKEVEASEKGFENKLLQERDENEAK